MLHKYKLQTHNKSCHWTSSENKNKNKQKLTGICHCELKTDISKTYLNWPSKILPGKRTWIGHEGSDQENLPELAMKDFIKKTYLNWPSGFFPSELAIRDFIQKTFLTGHQGSGNLTWICHWGFHQEYLPELAIRDIIGKTYLNLSLGTLSGNFNWTDNQGFHQENLPVLAVCNFIRKTNLNWPLENLPAVTIMSTNYKYN